MRPFWDGHPQLARELAVNQNTVLRVYERLAAEGVRAARELVEAKQASRPELLQAEMQLHAFRIALADANYRHLAAIGEHRRYSEVAADRVDWRSGARPAARLEL